MKKTHQMMIVFLLKKILRQYNKYPHISSNQLINVILHIVYTYIEIKTNEDDNGFLAAKYVIQLRKAVKKAEILIED